MSASENTGVIQSVSREVRRFPPPADAVARALVTPETYERMYQRSVDDPEGFWGDIAGSIDTEKVLAAGARDAVQINTGGNCHLEAHMIGQALDNLDLDALDIVFIENVGNLICPNHWVLGEAIKLCG